MVSFPFRRKAKQDKDQSAPEENPEAGVPIDGGEATPEPEPTGQTASPEESDEKTGLLSRLKRGLSKTSSQLGEGIGAILVKRKLDDETLDELEELLIVSDMGAPAAAKIRERFSKGRYEKEIDEEEIKTALAEEITPLLAPVEQPLDILPQHQPTVIMVVGVNGNGKTTTIGKLAMRYRRDGHQVMLAAADTFRAAAVEQLSEWARRADVPIVTGNAQADPASVAYTALERAKADGADILLIDTAGRLQNKQNLMAELAKIARVLKKGDERAPHHTLMVLDGTTGQNALSQVKHFKDCVDLTGLAVTKLDGTARGGVVVALADTFGLPIHYIGVGEQIDDLQTFDARQFARSLVGVA